MYRLTENHVYIDGNHEIDYVLFKDGNEITITSDAKNMINSFLDRQCQEKQDFLGQVEWMVNGEEKHSPDT